MMYRALLLPLLVLGVAAACFAQTATLASDVAPANVIVPWRHFGPQPSTSDDPPAVEAQTASAPPAPADPPEPAAPSSQDPPAPQASENQSGEPGAQPGSIYEADISKKHPHPPEPVALPLAEQSASPLSNDVLALPPEDQPVNRPAGVAPAAGAAATAPDNSPQGRIAAITAAYRQRKADRALRAAQIDSTGDAAARTRASIDETKLQLEGAKDRAETADQLSKAYADLAQELSDRASQTRSLADARKQTQESAEAGIGEVSAVAPRLDLARHNLSLLPKSDSVEQELRTLDAEIAQDRATLQQGKTRGTEAGAEGAALDADAAQLDDAAAQARQKSANLVEAAQNAQVEQRVLGDRLQYFAARQGAAELLASSSKALRNNITLTSDSNTPPAGSAPAAENQAATHGNCSANASGCARKGEQ